MIRYKLDPSSTTIVGVCREHGCGFRALSSTRAQAIRVRDEHEEVMHLVRGRHSTRRRTSQCERFRETRQA